MIWVNKKVDIAGFGPWTIREGATSVLPPAHFLENICTIRIHLDDCSQANGGLKVIPKSHLAGILEPQKINEIKSNAESIDCNVRKGGVLLMKPLTLHTSSKSTSEQHRKIIHLGFSSLDLPEEIHWAERIDCSFP